jgi:hypothetical protein
MGSGPLCFFDGYGSNRETTRIYVSSETIESVAQGADSYATNQTFEGLGVSPELVAVLTPRGSRPPFPFRP